MTADLRIEFGLIQAPAIFEKNITEVFLSPEKCQSFKTSQKNISTFHYYTQLIK